MRKRFEEKTTEVELVKKNMIVSVFKTNFEEQNPHIHISRSEE